MLLSIIHKNLLALDNYKKITSIARWKLIIFSGALFLFWFCIYAAYQVLYEHKQAMEDENLSPIW